MCKKWIHKKCSGVKNRLKAGTNYSCPAFEVCKSSNPSGEVVEKQLLVDYNVELEIVDRSVTWVIWLVKLEVLS